MVVFLIFLFNAVTLIEFPYLAYLLVTQLPIWGSLRSLSCSTEKQKFLCWSATAGIALRTKAKSIIPVSTSDVYLT